MSESLKKLGESYPAAGVLTDLYAVPGATSASCSSLFVCNQTNGTIKFRVSAALAGAADASSQYLYYDVSLSKNSSVAAVVGLALATTDVVRVQTDTLGVSFSLFGVEVTP